MATEKVLDEQKVITRKPLGGRPGDVHDGDIDSLKPFATLQQIVGNCAIQRLIAQRSDEGSFVLVDETADCINQERGGGQTLDDYFQKRMGQVTGQDFGEVRVHTSCEADELNKQLGAKAFTTGQEIFFREGEYQPQTSEGQQLIAHELTHVVQQASGAVSGGSGRLTVNPPGDRFEQEADAVAKEVVRSINSPQVQRQVPEEEDELQTRAIQRQAVPEEEEEQTLQRQELEEDEEELNA